MLLLELCGLEELAGLLELGFEEDGALLGFELAELNEPSLFDKLVEFDNSDEKFFEMMNSFC